MPASTTTATAQTRLGPSFTLMWSGEGVSLLGTATTSVLLPLLAVTHFPAGPGWMGVLTAAAWLPWLLIGLPAGAWLDRLDPRAVMITADLASAATLASVPLGWWLGFLTLPQLLVVALLGGAATVFFRTAHVKLLPWIVPVRDWRPRTLGYSGPSRRCRSPDPASRGSWPSWLLPR